MIHTLLALALQAQVGAGLPPDSVAALRQRARDAEARFERLARSRAPMMWDNATGGDCDEIVGRFCLRFDSTSAPPATAEDEAVAHARAEAVEAIRRYFSAAPGSRSAAGPLVRLLVIDGRAREAVSGAGAFAMLSTDTLWSELLLGFARHAAGDSDSAQAHFDRALARLDADERERWLDIEWLLDPPEQRAYERLTEAERAEYTRRFWLLADPFWMTPANERLAEHSARHAQARLLAEVPVVAGMTSWGRDLDELTIRYGTPTSRSQVRPGRAAAAERRGLVEYWDTAQRTYAPAQLSHGVPEQPPPGERAALYAATARSAYAYLPVRRVLELEHQITRFLDDDRIVLRVDAAVVADSTMEPAEPRRSPLPVTLIAYDSTLSQRHGAHDEAAWRGDSAHFTLQLDVPPGRVVYSAEALDTAAGVAARARYALDVHLPVNRPHVSDILVAAPFTATGLPERRDDPGLSGLPSLVLQRGDTLGLYAEVYRTGTDTAALRIELSLQPARPPSLLGRFARWVGRNLGVWEDSPEPRVGWRIDSRDVAQPIALNLPLDPRLRGAFVVVLRATDTATGRSGETRREILIR